MPLTAREQRILAAIEDELGHGNPGLVAALRSGRPPSPIRQQVPFWAGQLWVLTALLGALAVHPLLFELGVAGVGLLTGALVLPWLVTAARSAQRPADGAAHHPPV